MFTEKPAEIPLPLGQSLIYAHQWMTQSLINLMAARGHDSLTAAHLTFLNNLDCGHTHASAVARRMGISRQAVYRTTRELQKLGVLELLPDPDDRRQKVISMTSLGNGVANDAHASLAQIEKELARRIGGKDMTALRDILGRERGPVMGE